MKDSDKHDLAALPLNSDGPTLSPQAPAPLESLKVRLTDAQVAIRKDRYARQGFVPPGVVWHGALLSDTADQQIAAELGLPFEIREITLADEDEARLWIIEKSLEMPELNVFQRVRNHLQRKTLLLKCGRERMSTAAKGLSEMTNPPAPHDSRAQIAKASRVSRTQVFKVEYLLAHADPALLAQLEAGEVKISTAYDALQSAGQSDFECQRYAVLYLDPPAPIDIKRLREIPLKDLAAENAALFCWSHPCVLAKTLGLVRKWGFIYMTHFVLPLGKALMCDLVQENHDVLVFATRGKVTAPAVEDLPSTVIPETSGPDRPETVFTMIEKLFPSVTKVQICPRQPRADWEEWDFCGGRTKDS